MLLEALSAARDVGRLHEIASVLVSHGLGDLVRRVGIASALERAGKALNWKVGAELARKKPEEHLREAVEELGPTFVKLGQFLAGRPDLLAPQWTRELTRLHEDAAPVPFAKIRKEVETELGGSPEEIFRRFEEEPFAAASIGQVHEAELADGSPVVVKVRRPEIRDSVEADLRWLGRLAELLENEAPEMRRFRPRAFVRQFARTLEAELDLREEARNAKRLRRNLSAMDSIVVPRVVEAWTRESVLVLERLEGPSLGEWMKDPSRREVDPQRVARTGAEAFLRMIFEDGVFHADPHPGNILLLEDGRLGLLDFGMVGRLSETRRLEFVQLLVGVVERRKDDVVDVLLGWSPGDGVEADADRLGDDCGVLIERHQDVPLQDVELPALLAEVTELLREHRLYFPHDVALLLKVLLNLDGVGRSLDPDFSLVEHVKPFARRMVRENFSPFAILRRQGGEIRRLLMGLPGALRRLTRTLRQGRLRIDIDLKRLEDFSRQLDRTSNRLTVGMITSALIVGTAIALTVPGGPTLLGLPVFAALGFAAAAATGVWLVWSILRSGKR